VTQQRRSEQAVSEYFVIASRDPFDCADTLRIYEWVRQLAEAGQRVSLLLVQNGVLPARRGARWGSLTPLAERGVNLLVDRHSLAERALAEADLISVAQPTDIDCVID